MVSVPRRGFVNWSDGPWSGGQVVRKGRDELTTDDPTIRPIPFQSPEGDSLFFYEALFKTCVRRRKKVSVPRRGFVVFLRYARIIQMAMDDEFQSPEGDS